MMSSVPGNMSSASKEQMLHLLLYSSSGLCTSRVLYVDTLQINNFMVDGSVKRQRITRNEEMNKLLSWAAEVPKEYSKGLS